MDTLLIIHIPLYAPFWGECDSAKALEEVLESRFKKKAGM
jgi:hypothetical protein